MRRGLVIAAAVVLVSGTALADAYQIFYGPSSVSTSPPAAVSTPTPSTGCTLPATLPCELGA